MRRFRSRNSRDRGAMPQKPFKSLTLKELSALLGLDQSTVSRVVNGEADKYRISRETQQRVLEAAAMHGYSANSVARSLRLRRTHTVGVIVPEISEGYTTAVLGGIEDELLKEGYFYFVVSHRHRPDLLKDHPRMMLARAVEGMIAVDTPIEEDLPVPVVAVSEHQHRGGVVNIELDHARAAHLALSHLKELGHRKIAFIKGQAVSPETDRLWHAILLEAKALDIAIDPELVVQLENLEPGLRPGVEATRQLLQTGRSFTAIFAFNDLSAMGAILALRQASLRVPKDVSVVGFDDVLAASTHHPPLTTIHQPLRNMGQLAASTLLKLIREESRHPQSSTLTVDPRLVVRKSTSYAATAVSAAWHGAALVAAGEA
jgi:DNA-binding LacI/PurR family transcriptional regulator